MTLTETPFRNHLMTVRGWIPINYLDMGLNWKKAVRLRSVNRTFMMRAAMDQHIPLVMGPRTVAVDILSKKRKSEEYVKSIIVPLIECMQYAKLLLEGSSEQHLFNVTAKLTHDKNLETDSTILEINDWYAEDQELMNTPTALVFCPLCRTENTEEAAPKLTCAWCGYHV